MVLPMVSTVPVINCVNAVYLFQAVASALFGCGTSLRISKARQVKYSQSVCSKLDIRNGILNIFYII